jgi:hypothetical protein
MLEFLSFSLLFAKNLLLVNGNLYCESTIFFLSEAFEQTGDLQTDNLQEPTTFFSYETTPLKIWNLKEGGLHPVFLRENIVNFVSNFNFIDNLVLDLLNKNLIPSSSLMLYLNPDMVNATLNDETFNYFYSMKLAELPFFPLQQSNLTNQDLNNFCIFYGTKAMDIEKSILTDLVEVAIVKN